MMEKEKKDSYITFGDLVKNPGITINEKKISEDVENQKYKPLVQAYYYGIVMFEYASRFLIESHCDDCEYITLLDEYKTHNIDGLKYEPNLRWKNGIDFWLKYVLLFNFSKVLSEITMTDQFESLHYEDWPKNPGTYFSDCVGYNALDVAISYPYKIEAEIFEVLEDMVGEAVYDENNKYTKILKAKVEEESKKLNKDLNDRPPLEWRVWDFISPMKFIDGYKPEIFLKDWKKRSLLNIKEASNPYFPNWTAEQIKREAEIFLLKLECEYDSAKKQWGEPITDFDRMRRIDTNINMRKPLARRPRLVYEKLMSLQEYEAMDTPELLDWLSKKKIDIDEKTLRVTYLDPLKPWGLDNAPKVGYFIRRPKT